MIKETVKRLTTPRLNWTGIFKNYFFTQRQCLACAQWALGCRELDRRSAIHHLRIEEARDHLDLFQSAFEKLVKVRRALLQRKKIQSVAATVQEIVSLIDVAKKNEFAWMR